MLLAQIFLIPTYNINNKKITKWEIKQMVYWPC